jgi:hypothetical protein
MQRFFENKFAFLAVAVLFTVAFMWNLGHGDSSLLNGHGLMQPDASMTAHGASAPPDPNDGVKVAHGASAPPDPNDGLRANA